MAKENPSIKEQWARNPDVGLPQPDLCVFLSVSAENASKRGGFGEERFEKLEIQERVRKIFKVVQTKAIDHGETFVEIDGGDSFEEVEKKVLEAVESRFREVDAQQLPLRYVQA